MKNIALKAFSISLMCLMSFSYANAAQHKMSKTETHNAVTQLQMKVCHNKKQGEWVSYNYKGVLFNGTCQHNAHGKLQFMPPAPHS
ncbi:hypothetical protein [Acinetobacter silvestris]|uniref:Uncharacterized protein n=1 Tax=Acinetobacter silvestris TaxID=1977882 RepID=A0A1Y3CFY8_9GAMM|nr:hypothetical protein [Acinetobacter silvestris]OTG66031.1 hypothetical protein B9T28_07505 [Acinetobacter silvestris]